jgi:hypothetical protein
VPSLAPVARAGDIKVRPACCPGCLQSSLRYRTSCRVFVRRWILQRRGIAGEASARAVATPVRDGVWFSDTIDVSTLVCVDYESEEDMQRTSRPPAGVTTASVPRQAPAKQPVSRVCTYTPTHARARAHETTRHDSTRKYSTHTHTCVRALTDELRGGH